MEPTIDPITWFSERELKYTPKHFVVAKAQLTTESKLWILNNLKGRFTIVNEIDDDSDIFQVFNFGHPAFEDPKEAVLFELKWS